LSILDKIVSFTNGELTYTNTLEHLNILDADYYFRILDAMLQQNLSDALLVYDSINRKGFEGDLVLNGLAEFIRNLLVCKDEKVAGLLEVVESFRDRYITAGRGADTIYLISALNVLNEAEVNYKSARNKRLHVELALIKLCYLAQALQVSNGEGGKKKQHESLRPVSFRNIPAMEPVRQRVGEGARLLIETGVKREEAAVEAASKEGEAQVQPSAQPATGGRSGSLGSLSRIRQQFASRSQNDDAASSRPLETEALHRAWQQYADYLRENRNPAVQSLELAELRIVDDQTFEVVTGNNLEQKFIEQEKRNLSDHLQKIFVNKAVSFSVTIEEKAADIQEPTDRPMNKREQFQQIVDQYPLVKELKDRLRLELDY
jgi:DNA polymerase III subunit gamma/tau